MALRITHIRIPIGQSGNKAITDFTWQNDETGKIDSSTKDAMVEWLDKPSTSAYVTNGNSRVAVGVVSPKTGTPYLRTYANGAWTDNLLSLPRF